MFPKSILHLVDENTPKINPDIANGLAVKHLAMVESYVDSIFRSTSRGFPEGMTYDGCRRCTPDEQYREMTRNINNKTAFEVAPSNLFLMEYSFSYKGEKLIPKKVYLPYVGAAGYMFLNGPKFAISPVLTDRVISITNKNIFVKLLKAKLIFNRLIYHYMEGDSRVNVPIVFSKIYNSKNKGELYKPMVTAKTTLVHYLLCKYGFVDMFKQYTGCEPVIGYSDVVNPANYPPDKWVITTSSGIKPKTVKGKFHYAVSEIYVAISKEEYTSDVKSLLVGFYYILDHFPNRVRIEDINNTRLWMVLLGLTIWTNTISEGKIYSDVYDHIVSLDEYIDSLVSKELVEIGYECKDIYDLFYLIINRFDNWLLCAEDKVSTMYDKKISILYYVCYDIIASITNVYFKLKNASKKELTSAKINTILKENLTTSKIFNIKSTHDEVSNLTTSGDNKFFNVTCVLVPQTSSRKKDSKRGGKGGINKEQEAIKDPAKRLHVSVAEIGGVANLPKSEPSGRSRINPFLKISETGLVLRDPQFVELLDSIQHKIKR
jgi:hypothetical protein